MVQWERVQRGNGPDWRERGKSSATKEKNTWIEKGTFYNENKKVKLWKSLKLWTNGIKTFWQTTASWVSKDKAFLKLRDPACLLRKRRHTIEGLPTSVRVNKTTESDSKVKETDNNVFRAIENNFKFLSIACGNKPRLTSITNTLRPEAAGHQFRICACPWIWIQVSFNAQGNIVTSRRYVTGSTNRVLGNSHLLECLEMLKYRKTWIFTP